MAAHVSLSDSLRVSVALQQSRGAHESGQYHHRPRARSRNSLPRGVLSATNDGRNDRSLSCGNRVLLAAVAYGPEAHVSFELVYSVLSLQYLGVPVYLVSMNGIVCGLLSMFLIPYMGSFADRGSNPKRRRRLSLLVGLSMFVCGFWIMAIASALKAEYLKEITEESQSHNIGSGRMNFYLQNATSTFISNNTSGIYSTTKENRIAFPSVFTNESTNAISTTGILGILGFTFLDIGFDCSMSQIRTFLVDNVPDHQNSLILATSSVVMSFGGILNTSLGMLDLPSILGPILGMDGVAATLIVLSLGISTLTIAAYVTSFAMGYWVSRTHYYKQEEKQCLISKESSLYQSKTDDPIRSKCRAPAVYQNGSFKAGQTSLPSSKTVDAYTSRGPSVESRVSRPSFSIERKALKRKPAFLTEWAFIFNARLLLVFMATFLSFGCLSVVTIYLSNTFTIEVVKGDPTALPGTDAKARYEEGLRGSSTAALISYLTYLAFIMPLKKLIDSFGARQMFLIGNALMSASSTLFCVFQSESTYFVLLGVYGLYRCIVYIAPFLLATTYTRKQLSNNNRPTTSADDDNLGKVMSIVGFLFTSSYLLVSSLLAPLMDVTGSAWPPAYFLSGATALAVLPLAILLFL